MPAPRTVERKIPAKSALRSCPSCLSCLAIEYISIPHGARTHRAGLWREHLDRARSAEREQDAILDPLANFLACNILCPMHIPHTRLSLAALRAIVEEFVTRDGTDHSRVDRRIETVLRQLDAGTVQLHFDVETRTCNILPTE